MPKADFYAGLPLAEQLEKFAEHHHDPQVRHISADEAAILDTAVRQLKRGITPQQRRREFNVVWRQLEHVYETRVVSARSEFNLLATSIPSRATDVPPDPIELFPEEWVIASDTATPRLAQVGLNVLFRQAVDPDTDVGALWIQTAARRSPPTDPGFGEAENELLNRALYQPTIAIEGSPPIFESISGILGQTAESGWQSLVAETMDDPVTILGVGGTLIVLKILRGPAQGLSQGLKERLYEWARPDRSSED